jgi:hypothetical protein
MKLIIAYQIFLLLVIVTGACLILQGRLPTPATALWDKAS